MAGPIVFTNLYKIHDYYCTANTLFFSLTFGFFLLSVLESRKHLILYLPGSAMIIFLACWSGFSYFDKYYLRQVHEDRAFFDVGMQIKNFTKATDVTLVVGQDWSSEIPYYSERKSVCVPNWLLPEISSETDSFLEKLKSSNITAYVETANGVIAPEVRQKIIDHLGLSPTPHPISGGYCNLFILAKK
jgi:hypothetical protein